MAIATGLQWILEAEGMTVRIVGTAREVLPAVDAFKPDVILLDLSLPDASGREVYEQVKGRAPVIFSTGNFSELQLVDSGIEHVRILLKPYTAEDLVRTIDGVLSSGL